VETELSLMKIEESVTKRAQPIDDNFVVKWMPRSVVAEQYRVGATRLAMFDMNGGPMIAAVTSAVKGEGKTTTVINLGYTLARDLGKRTLLLDCDFLAPMLQRYMDSIPQWGLADCLTNEIPIEQCLSGFGDVPCWIMPVGSSDIPPNQLLRSERLHTKLMQLREQFDYILINTPPILPLATMNALVSHVDLLLVVVRANATPHQVVKGAVKSLRARVPVHIVLNRVASQALPSYMYDYAYSEKQIMRS